MAKHEETLEKLAGHYARILTAMGYDYVNDPHLKETPERAAKAILELGVIREMPVIKCFPQEGMIQMVIQNGIFVMSLCPHHLLPWFGTVSIGYLPGFDNRVLGLSKLARLVRYHGRQLTTQEELTSKLAQFLVDSELKPAGVGVSVRAYHTCMALRGAMEPSALTTTNALTGAFRDFPAVRAEFLQAVEHPTLFR